jgi:hypothetical protein
LERLSEIQNLVFGFEDQNFNLFAPKELNKHPNLNKLVYKLKEPLIGLKLEN